MAVKGIIIPGVAFNNLNLKILGGKPKIAVPKRKVLTTPVAVSYGVKLWFQQWDQTIAESATNPGALIPNGGESLYTTPIVYAPNTVTQIANGDSFLKLLRGLPQKTTGEPSGVVSSVVFQGDDNPNYDHDTSPYLMDMTVDNVTYAGWENTSYDMEGSKIVIHWEGESWMYFVGSPGDLREIIDGSSEPHGDVYYPVYLIYQFTFVEPGAGTGPDINNPGNDALNGFNRYITSSGDNPTLVVDPNDSNTYLNLTMSWEKMEFDYEVRAEAVDGTGKLVFEIKNFKILNRIKI
jgi:hypothetical protein